MLQGKNMVTQHYMYIFNPWIKSTPLGLGLLSRYVVNQIPQRIKSTNSSEAQEEEEDGPLDLSARAKEEENENDEQKIKALMSSRLVEPCP